ncbi:MAG: hypothetical protein LH624_01175 [Cryobacterium sp.]|nr:hypothetical protein [Cryobacterium sp.]
MDLRLENAALSIGPKEDAETTFGMWRTHLGCLDDLDEVEGLTECR